MYELNINRNAGTLGIGVITPLLLLAYTNASEAIPIQTSLDSNHYKTVMHDGTAPYRLYTHLKTKTQSPLIVPTTALGKKLHAIRQKAIANGLALMNNDQISQELENRRGQ